MGGLAGIVRWDSQPVKVGEINAMLARIRHRGPDGLTCQLHAQVGFGHALMALDNNEYPGCGIAWTADRSLFVVADARLYNRYDLARDLDLSRDTSVANLILHGYKRWGSALLDHIDGDFSFAAFDVITNQIFAGRDIFGTEPFFFATLANRFIFGSEPKQLLGFHFGVSAEPEPLEVARFLADQPSGGESTVWKGIQRLRPGHFLVGTSKSVKQTAYWRPKLENGRNWKNRLDCIAEVRYTLTEAVARRLDVAVPVALELSGGYDSSSLALLAAELSMAGKLGDGAKLSAISVTYPGFVTDESRFIGSVSERLPYPTFRLEAPLDTTNIDLAEECWKLDSPAVFVETVRDQREAETIRLSGSRVLVTGFGGDDLFWEPNHGLDLLLNREFKLFWQWFRTVMPTSFRSFYHMLRSNLLNIDPVRSAYPVPDFENRSSKEIFCWLTSPRLNRYTELIEIVRSYQGLELRHPFLDRQLAELILSIPTRLRVTFQGRLKPLLQDAMEDLLPQCVLTRNNKATFDPYFIHLFGQWCKHLDVSFRDGLTDNSYFQGLIKNRRLSFHLIEQAKLWSQVWPIWGALNLQKWLAGISQYSRDTETIRFTDLDFFCGSAD